MKFCLLSAGVYLTFTVSITVLVNIIFLIYHYQENTVSAFHPVLIVLMMIVCTSPVNFTNTL